MDPEGLRAARMRAHRLTDPASGVVAARHMTATQSQEFTSGRWALAVRSTGSPALADVDAAFERGERIRSWTQRGTVHILDPHDLGWMRGITPGRQLRQAAGVHRRLGIDDDVLARAESAVRPVLRGDNRLTRREVGTVLTDAGIDATGMRANLILVALCLRRLVVLGPVVPREGAPSREQYVVAADEWVEDATAPAGPLAEILVRYLRGHGPAGLADFRWWAGPPLGLARSALEGAGTRAGRRRPPGVRPGAERRRRSRARHRRPGGRHVEARTGRGPAPSRPGRRDGRGAARRGIRRCGARALRRVPRRRTAAPGERAIARAGPARALVCTIQSPRAAAGRSRRPSDRPGLSSGVEQPRTDV